MAELDYEDRQLLRKRVHLGAEWLDERQPDWWLRIDVDRLHIANCTRCVLGQMFGEFVIGVSRFGLHRGDLVDMGFAMDPAVKIAARGAYWAALNDAWREQILARRTAAGTDG